MIFINWQIVRSARSILLNSDSAAWRFRTMLRSAMWCRFNRSPQHTLRTSPRVSRSSTGIVTLSEIGPIWTTDRQDKSLKLNALKSSSVGKFQSNRLNVTTPSRMLPGLITIKILYQQATSRYGLRHIRQVPSPRPKPPAHGGANWRRAG